MRSLSEINDNIETVFNSHRKHKFSLQKKTKHIEQFSLHPKSPSVENHFHFASDEVELASTHKYLHANLERSIDNVALINVDKESYGNVTEVSGT